MKHAFSSPYHVAYAFLRQHDIYSQPDKAHAAQFLAGMSWLPFVRPFALTCAGKTDGGGAQVQAVMSVLAFCHAFGYRYAHTPFRTMEHTGGPQEVAAWENLFNLGAGEIAAADLPCPIVMADAYIKSPGLWLRRTAVEVEYLHPFTDAYPKAYMPIRDSLRRKYRGSPIISDPGVLTVAVHIRRGDVTLSAHQLRYTGNDAILARVRAVRMACESAGRRCRFIVHSQGSPQDFAELVREGCDLRLNAEALISFNELVHADILLMAKSSFSYVAGILSRGVILYEPFWCAALPGWIDAADPEKLAEKVRLIVR